jgi:dTDP-4-amino-4,6-dideoxygalactose transaminase
MSADARILEIVRQSGSLQKFILGENVKRFEARLEARMGARHAIAVASGAGAIAVSLMAADIGPGDEVIVPAFASPAAAGAVVTVGATPVFVDVEERTMVMDPARITEKTTPRTRALIPSHLFCCMADMPAIMVIAQERGLLVIEDAEALHGTRLDGIPAGLWGDIGTFSFSPSTVMNGCGETGMIVTDNDELAAECRLIRNHGQQEGIRFIHKRIGLNSRMDEIQAMFLDQKLDSLDNILAEHARLAELYRSLLAPLADRLTLPPAATFGRCYHAFILQTADRHRLRLHLQAEGIQAQVYCPTILPHQACFAACSQSVNEFANAERASRQNLALPLYDGMTDEQVSTIAKAVLAFPRS